MRRPWGSCRAYALCLLHQWSLGWAASSSTATALLDQLDGIDPYLQLAESPKPSTVSSCKVSCWPRYTRTLTLCWSRWSSSHPRWQRRDVPGINACWRSHWIAYLWFLKDLKLPIYSWDLTPIQFASISVPLHSLSASHDLSLPEDLY